MATRATNANGHVAPSPDLSDLPERSQTIPLGRPEDLPIPYRATSIDGAGVLDNGDNGTTSGRKRKLNSMSSRGVANLTPDQLAKKRANDRQAQRAIRERTKGHIEALEQQVRDLSSQKPYLDLQAALCENETIRSENAELRQGLKAAMDILQPLMAKPELPGKLRIPLEFKSEADKDRSISFSSYTKPRPAPFTYTPIPRHRSPHAHSRREILRRVSCQPRHAFSDSFCTHSRESPQQYHRRPSVGLSPCRMGLATP